MTITDNYRCDSAIVLLLPINRMPHTNFEQASLLRSCDFLQKFPKLERKCSSEGLLTQSTDSSLIL